MGKTGSALGIQKGPNDWLQKESRRVLREGIGHVAKVERKRWLGCNLPGIVRRLVSRHGTSQGFSGKVLLALIRNRTFKFEENPKLFDFLAQLKARAQVLVGD